MQLEKFKRRTYLGAVVTGTGTLAGCLSNGNRADDNTGEQTGSEGDPAGDQDSVYHVAPNGNDSSSGTETDPLATIHEGLKRAKPGDSIKAASGEYFENGPSGGPLQTLRAGKPDAPITITGPEDAILRPSIRIRHSHIRLTGLTIEGLVDPDHPDDPSSYTDYPVGIRPPDDSDEYLQDIVCAPSAVGYSAYALIRVLRTKNLEIGPIRVSGLAGASWILPEEPNRHAGEIIYLGAPPGMYELDSYPWPGIDRTRNVHIHHIDNSEGYPHSELVDAKVGTQNIVVEYCTDGGGSQNTESEPTQSIALDGYNSTLRWCDLKNGDGHAVVLSGDGEKANEQFDIDIPSEVIGTNHSVYGNRASGFGREDLFLVMTEPEDQEALCGNEMSGVLAIGQDHSPKEIDYDPTQPCSNEVPAGDEIGHTGGDSPWG